MMNLKLGALPHGLAVMGTVIIFFAAFAVLVLLVVNEVSALLADQEFVDELDAFKESIYETLNESGVKIVRDLDPRYTSAELNSYFDMFMAVFNAFALQLLLTMYIMFEKVEVNMFSGQTMSEIEKQVTGYISLKTALSLLTGAVVAVILVLLRVKLAVMFGILSFVLNYIPNVGSMIAMFLPMPVVIVDKNLEQWQKIGAFVGPGAVQAYVGNALEPMMFGKSLNMTPMSILAALVIWGSVWGIIGAILSVPMLTIQKILLTKANHPLAKHTLAMIREDASIDENDPDGAEAKKLKQDTGKGPMPKAGNSASEMSSREQDIMVNPLQAGSQLVVASSESLPPDAHDDAEDV
jgi:AI-2 transport protein TqsA